MKRQRKSRRWCGYLIEPYEPAFGPLLMDTNTGRERWTQYVWRVHTDLPDGYPQHRTFPTLSQCRHFICRLILEEEW
jgi:hypothetical protein